MTAEKQFTRIVSLVAELSKRARNGDGEIALGDLARAHDVRAEDITKDLVDLTTISEQHAEADWMLSLSVTQQHDRISLSSAGPFRRPVLLSPEERLAIKVALAVDPEGAALAARFAALEKGRKVPASSPSAAPDERLTLLRIAARDRREVAVSYTAEGERLPVEWLLEPHQIAQSNGRTYIVAWTGEDWRHFRLDRVLSVSATGRVFEPRSDFVALQNPGDVFKPGLEMDKVTVRFSATIAPGIVERYPVHTKTPDGRVDVVFTTASPEWLARKILEYGRDAEVVNPERYRLAVRRAVA